MAEKCYELDLPLGISRARSRDDINGLRAVLGDFGTIDFNVSRTSTEAYSIRITRNAVPTAHGGEMDLDETVSGLIEDQMRLTYGEYVQILRARTQVRVRFSRVS